jgi:serine phosphatase RsbU (regulator of sigma subunit)
MKTVTIHRVIEGKIVEARHTANTAGFWQQRLQRERIERARIEQELQVARSFQQASLPKEVPILEGWEISPYYQPAREVGGDFYDFLELKELR